MLFPCRNWKPTLAIKLSILVLASCIIATLWQPALWPWTLGIIFANHSVITIAGLIPRSTLLGPNITRLPPDAAQRGEVAITIDDGPDPEVTPQVLDILDRHRPRPLSSASAGLPPAIRSCAARSFGAAMPSRTTACRTTGISRCSTRGASTAKCAKRKSC